MAKADRLLRITSPIGSVPRTDEDLHARLSRLPSDSNIEKAFKEITEWEENAVKKSKEREQTAKSGLLHIVCR
jgi:hypothetical protein